MLPMNIRRRIGGAAIVIALLLLQGCGSRDYASLAVNRALEQELANNQQLFLNQPVSEVQQAFQRQPTQIAIIDKKNNAVWQYDIYDILIDPQTGNPIVRPGQISLLTNKIHWKEYYYTNSDGIVYDIKVEGETF